MPELIEEKEVAEKPVEQEAAPVQAEAAEVLANPRGKSVEELGRALETAEKGEVPQAAQRPKDNAASVPFDPQAAINELKKALETQQSNLSKELAQHRKTQSDLTRLPDLIKANLAKIRDEEKKQERTRSLTAEERLQEQERELMEKSGREEMQALIRQEAQRMFEEMQREKEAPELYIRQLQTEAGDRYAELEPYLKQLVQKLREDIRSDDPEVSNRALNYYDAMADNYSLALWQAQKMAYAAASKGNGQGSQAQQPQREAQPGQVAAPKIDEQAKRLEAARQASPQARGASPKTKTTLTEMSPDDVRKIKDPKELERLLAQAEGS